MYKCCFHARSFRRCIGVVSKWFIAITVAIMVAGLHATPSHASTPWYVSAATGSNLFDCLSPLTACKTIKAAIGKAAPDDSINVASGLYVEHLTLQVNLTINGAGASTTIIDAANIDHVVEITAGVSANVSNVTLQHGMAITSGGGGIRNNGVLILSGVVVTGNTGNHGGGIRNESVMTITNSTISGNVASTDGGGIYSGFNSATYISGSSIHSNQAPLGAGIRNDSVLVITGSNVVSNIASADGGGIYNSGGGSALISATTLGSNGAANGGGIRNDNALTMTGSTVISNTATAGGGGIYSSASGNTLIDNATITNNAASNGGGIRNSGDLVAIRSAISNNTASTGGGGIYMDLASTSTVSNGTIGGNSAPFGAGIRTNSALTLTGSTITNNSASIDGGGFYVAVSSTLALDRSAIVNNSAGEDGGGIFVALGVSKLAIVNSTIGLNSANNSGGGILNKSTITLTNDTLNANTAPLGRGANLLISKTVQLNNTIIANGSGGNCASAVGFSTLSLGHNLDSGNTCGLSFVGDVSLVDPRLSTLYVDTVAGNLTPAFALLPGSPAIDKGDNAGCPATDQRGVTRPIDGNRTGHTICDIGAYEFNLVKTNYFPIVIHAP